MGKHKLSDEDRLTIVTLHNRGKGVSIRKLASMYKVSRGTIKYTVDPAAADKMRAQARARQRKLRGEMNNASS